MAEGIRTENLDVGYDRAVLVSGINIRVRPGRITTLIGPNGAGKSTILKTLAGQLPPLGGKVLLLGRDMREIPEKETAKSMSIVMTERIRTSFMTCRDVAATGRYPYTGRLGILTDRDRQVVEDVLKLVHAEDVADQDFMKVSDGQRQRVMLARALCQEPSVLLLDEPTSFLDLRFRLDILQVIRDAAREKKIAVLMSLHELDLAQKVSDEVVCLGEDRAIWQGTPEEVFSGGHIEKLYHLPEGAYDPLLGISQLPKRKGEPVVFLIGGGGGGISTIYRLQREGIPFAAGIYMENDVECGIARALSVQAVTSPRFVLPGEKEICQAKELIDRCRRVICPDPEPEKSYPAMRVLIEYARKEKKLCPE